MEEILKILEKEYHNYLDMLKSLVNVDSGSSNILGVNKVLEIIQNKFKQLGGNYEIQIIPQKKCGNHIVINRKGSIFGKILLLGHMDTVFQDGTVQKRPFKIEGDKAFGPGIIDMKAGITSIYFALKVIDILYKDDVKTIQMIFNSDEEISSIYSRELIENLSKDCDCVLVLEAGRHNGDVVTSRKGTGKYKIRIKGKASHAGGNLKKGANSIIELCHKLIQISNLTDYETGTTVNVGLIKGGSASNTVPAYSDSVIDVRICTLEEAQKIDENIRKIANEIYIKGTSTIVEGGIKRPPMERKEENVKLYEIAKRIGEELGMSIGQASTGGGSDANFTSALGIPTLDGLGPTGGGVHTEDEYINLNSIVPRTALLTKLIKVLSEN
ncbi:M20 family metallopeptidase [Alkalithermobacter paradoxus]|uniref:Carboxypeptidase G2 n=1 Tax=Alkalithermobacter paradoxus TaxID=29349 RepID=A0A1V4IAS5_9FIRM|nr:carboxypeptidase G2 precursor [[Clostridium] thermoalcaliphilum]